MALLRKAEATADDAMRVVEREIRQLDEEIGSIGRTSGGEFESKVGRGVRHVRPGQ
jgi:hypothetical protein